MEENKNKNCASSRNTTEAQSRSVKLTEAFRVDEEDRRAKPLSPSVPDSRILFQRGTHGSDLLGTALQHVALHVGLEGAVEILEGLSFVQGKHLTAEERLEPRHRRLQ